jgi:hypothetical protein
MPPNSLIVRSHLAGPPPILCLPNSFYPSLVLGRLLLLRVLYRSYLMFVGRNDLGRDQKDDRKDERDESV